ncbi:MAG: DNA polymerase II large subunit [Nitrososphaerales archaeon]
MSQDPILSRRLITYQNTLEKGLERAFTLSNSMRNQGLDPSNSVESFIATDLADRVAKLLGAPIVDRLRSLTMEERTEQAALTIATEVASGKYSIAEGQTPAEAAVRIGLAVVTDGVTVAPLQGVSAVTIRENQRGSKYLSIEFAGPIRSAGGTESAFTLVIADQVRKTLGLEKYNSGEFDDEASRFVEELRIYERDVGNFQYKVSDKDVRKAITNVPVEINGVWTDNYEVVVHRDLQRIATNKLRGGALRVLNDGLIGKSKKMLKLLDELGINDWAWLSELSGGKQQGSDETKATSSHFEDVISGRPVLSVPGRAGGFRLRYGRSINTGIHGVGIHPAVTPLLDYPIVVGTQIKVDIPGKAASVAFVDTIEGPIVRLKDKSVVRIKDADQATTLAPQLESIIYLGDILIGFGDFLENNTRLVPSPYVEEWWAHDLQSALAKRYTSLDSAGSELQIEKGKLQNYFSSPLEYKPSLDEARRISETTGIPLHPKYLLYWDQLNPQQILELRETLKVKEPISLTSPISSDELVVTASVLIKPLLENLGVEHHLAGGDRVIITGDPAAILLKCLGLQHDEAVPKLNSWTTSIELVSQLCGLTIRGKSSAFIGVRVGRPEKAMPRKMKPPIHGLFPVGKSEGLSRDLLSAVDREPLLIEIVNMQCPECNSRVFSAKCPVCKSTPERFKTCSNCGRREFNLEIARCKACNGPLKPCSIFSYPLKLQLKTASLRVGYNPSKPLKGVLGLSNELKMPERLEKVLLRQKYGLSVYKDGTIRYDLTNVPLTHFRPFQIHATIDKLSELGYKNDINGDQLEKEDQTLELLPQDIVIPYEAGTFLIAVSKYIDELLLHHYGESTPYYKIEGPEDIVGHLILGLAPHTSVGVIGRVIGYTNAQACFASPYWHSAKRRDCDGDSDSIILLMDTLLNFSKQFLPSIIGGLMDAPLLIQPSIIPKEVQRQAHHMDVMSRYPEEFYLAAQQKQMPASIEPKMDIIKHRLGTKDQFENFGFTHHTKNIMTKQSRSSYSTLTTLNEKLDRQIEIAEKIRAVNPDEVVKSVLRTHLLPDIIGNTKAFTAQKFRCKKCGSKFRRMPVRGNCLTCGSELQPSVTRGSVEKYLQLGLRLSQKYDVGGYLRSRFVMASEELETLFKPQGQQMDVSDYFEAGSDASQTPQTEEKMSLGETFTLDNPSLQDETKSIEPKEQNTHKHNKMREENQTTLF